MRTKICLQIIFNVIWSALMIFFSLISPYAYEWDESLIQIDYDALLVLKILWITIAVAVITTTTTLFNTKKWLRVWDILLIIYAIYKVIALLLI